MFPTFSRSLFSKVIKEVDGLPEFDHRTIGKQQQLFVFHKQAPGSAFFLPHGVKIYNKLQEYFRKQYRERGYEEVISPQLYNKELWEQSGHLEKYAENIYMIQDDSMGLKPMNCPGHCLLYQMQQHSYKELPIRYADFGVLHRNEVHGSLSGLTRVRKFTQDDAHIFCTIEQVQSEMKSVLSFLHDVYSLLGFTYELTLSTRPPLYIGDLETWNNAEQQLKLALQDHKYSINEGDGAFYGPKIDVMIKDMNGKSHQCGTIQLDFNLPERFNLFYRTSDDFSNQDKQGFQRPVMIHRAILGSIERMIAILAESYQGKWPFWLSPRQILVIAMNQDYGNQIYKQLFDRGFNVEIDSSDLTLNKKIRRGHLFNYILLAGDKEQQQGTVDVRERGKDGHRGLLFDQFLNEIQI